MATCSPLMSPRIIGFTPKAHSPMHMRRISEDLPNPGLAITKAEGFEIRRSFMNQEIGSQHTGSPVITFRPSGTPTMGEPPPRGNGYSPQIW